MDEPWVLFWLPFWRGFESSFSCSGRSCYRQTAEESRVFSQQQGMRANQRGRKFRSMLKTISVRELRLGMHIEKMCGNWVDHPFWRSSFTLADSKDLQTLQSCGLTEVVIDTGRGLDVEAVPAAPAASAPIREIAVPPRTGEIKVSMEKELERARQIQAKAKWQVTSLFKEARMGKLTGI
jgi:hypothetical protein